MNVIFTCDFMSVWKSFQDISVLNCIIYVFISAMTLGFTCFKSVCRF